MQGLNRQTGQKISGIAWLEQQITDILTTPKMARTMRAEYGSDLNQFIDNNVNDDFGIEIIIEVNQALKVLETAFKLKSVKVKNDVENIELDIVGSWLETGELINLSGVRIT